MRASVAEPSTSGHDCRNSEVTFRAVRSTLHKMSLVTEKKSKIKRGWKELDEKL